MRCDVSRSFRLTLSFSLFDRDALHPETRDGVLDRANIATADAWVAESRSYSAFARKTQRNREDGTKTKEHDRGFIEMPMQTRYVTGTGPVIGKDRSTFCGTAKSVITGALERKHLYEYLQV